MILFGVDKWVLSVATEKRIAGVHTVFFQQAMGKWARMRRDGTWWQEEAESIMKEMVTQYVWTYINKNQATVAQWAALYTIFEVCAWETGHKDGG